MNIYGLQCVLAHHSYGIMRVPDVGGDYGRSSCLGAVEHKVNLTLKGILWITTIKY